MVAGVLVTNTAGTVQIDDHYRNIYMSTKGVVNMVASQISTVTVSGVDPIIVISGPALCGLQFRQNNGGGSFTFNLAGKETGTNEYFIFDIVVPNLSSRPNFVVWDDRGQVTFHSGMKPLRVIDTLVGTVSDNPTTRTYGAGIKTGVAISNLGADLVIVAIPNQPNLARYLRYFSFFKTSNNVVYINPGFIEQTGPRPTNYTGAMPFSWNGMVVDVTNY